MLPDGTFNPELWAMLPEAEQIRLAGDSIVVCLFPEGMEHFRQLFSFGVPVQQAGGYAYKK